MLVFSWSTLELLHVFLSCLFFTGADDCASSITFWHDLARRFLMRTSVPLMTTDFLTSYHAPRELSLYKRNTSYSKLLLADGIFHLLILRKRLPVPTVVSRGPEHNWCSDGRLFYSIASEVGTAAWLPAGQLSKRLIPGGDKRCSLFQSVQPTIRTGGSLRGGKAAAALSWPLTSI